MLFLWLQFQSHFSCPRPPPHPKHSLFLTLISALSSLLPTDTHFAPDSMCSLTRPPHVPHPLCGGEHQKARVPILLHGLRLCTKMCVHKEVLGLFVCLLLVFVWFGFWLFFFGCLFAFQPFQSGIVGTEGDKSKRQSMVMIMWVYERISDTQNLYLSLF